jgi:hypothetical protein
MYTLRMSTKNPSKTRTIRINQDSDYVIQRDAERLGMSANALINKILLHYINSHRYYESGNMISMSTNTFMTIFNQLSKNDVEDTAYGLGNQKVNESLMRRGMEVDYKNVIWYLSQILGEYNGWFRCDLLQESKVDHLHLSHTYTRKWSDFLANYVSSMFRDILGLEVQPTILENAVNFEITKKTRQHENTLLARKRQQQTNPQ